MTTEKSTKADGVKKDLLSKKIHYVPKEVIDELNQRKDAKEKLKRVFLPLDDNNDEIQEVIVEVPNRRVLSQYMKWIDNNPSKAQDILINECLLTSKEAVKADDALYNTCVAEIAGLIPIRQGRTKNF